MIFSEEAPVTFRGFQGARFSLTKVKSIKQREVKKKARIVLRKAFKTNPAAKQRCREQFFWRFWLSFSPCFFLYWNIVYFERNLYQVKYQPVVSNIKRPNRGEFGMNVSVYLTEMTIIRWRRITVGRLTQTRQSIYFLRAKKIVNYEIYSFK